MTRIHPARTRIERQGSERARQLRADVSSAVRSARQDAGLSLGRLARAAGVSASTLAALERERHDPSTEVLARLGAALGMELSVRLYPGTGPIIRDHLQAAMIEALIGLLDDRWRPLPEVLVRQPVRGVIDLVLDSATPPLVAIEAHSQLRRLEQQVRWSRTKADALATARSEPVGRLLLLRSTAQTRAIASEYEATLSAAYPARTADAYDALVGDRAWPGDAIVWCQVEGGTARILPGPPRNVGVGR